VAEDAQVVQLARVGDARDVEPQRFERIGALLVGLVALAVAPVVEGDHPVVLRQRVEMVGEVLLRTADAVDEEQSGRIRISHRDGCEGDAVVGGHPHRVNLRPSEQAMNEPVT